MARSTVRKVRSMFFEIKRQIQQEFAFSKKIKHSYAFCLLLCATRNIVHNRIGLTCPVIEIKCCYCKVLAK
jgi:hypothetical protein